MIVIPENERRHDRLANLAREERLGMNGYLVMICNLQNTALRLGRSGVMQHITGGFITGAKGKYSIQYTSMTTHFT